MKIRIIANAPINNQEGIENYIGREYEVLPLAKYYNKDIVKEMNKLKEVAVFLETNDRNPSILNEFEYEIIE